MDRCCDCDGWWADGDACREHGPFQMVEYSGREVAAVEWVGSGLEIEGRSSRAAFSSTSSALFGGIDRCPVDGR